jgi:lysyl endopeptidase
MRWFYIAVAIMLSTSLSISGQISAGGRPLPVPALKSQGIPVKVMPGVNNQELLNKLIEKQQEEKILKSFRFAHTFDVNFSPQDEGIWITGVRGYDIWRLKIRSAGAKSLNLIFNKFHLPQHARLFLYNEKENHYLGAYTSNNNKTYQKFAVSPVAGEEITIQYEVPEGIDGKNDFIISRVNHDFVGILKYDRRRPSGDLPGECNIDINCAAGKNWKIIKNSVCRLISGSEICTGTLVNNTAEDQRPYIISAAHCFEDPEDAETTVFTFNYESPYCGVIDGDPANSISGAFMRSYSDSLDFALVELSVIPPPEFMPYYAGWDNNSNIPDSTTIIHQPQGYIKKIAVDRDKPIISDYRTEYTKDGFLRIVRWDLGVTEPGSSGGPLFNPEQNVIGTLTGGEATCAMPVNDYFSRFKIAWEFRSDSSKQLKVWLDPLRKGVDKLHGKQYYEGESFCLAYTNLTDEDIHDNIPVINSGKFAGYWGGTNELGINGFAGRFSIPGNEQLHSISIGVGKIDLHKTSSDSEIEINIYNGRNNPETSIYSQTVKINSLVQEAMNLIEFDEIIEPEDTFFIGFELSGMNALDTFVVFQSLRPKEKENFFYFKQNGIWYDFKNSNTENYSMANVFELIACNVDEVINDTPHVNKPLEALIYPNPANSVFTLEACQFINDGNISVYNLIGKEVEAKFIDHGSKAVQIDLAGNIPGIYFVRLKTEKGIITKKVSYIPW